MRITIEVDDRLLERARSYLSVDEDSLLIHEALQALIQREASRRLADLGGSEPELRDIPRRRL